MLVKQTKDSENLNQQFPAELTLAFPFVLLKEQEHTEATTVISGVQNRIKMLVSFLQIFPGQLNGQVGGVCVCVFNYFTELESNVLFF